MKRSVVVILLTISTVHAGSATRGADGNTHVLIVTGINKDAKDRQSKDKAVMDLRTFFLSKALVKNDRLVVLANSRSLVDDKSQVSTAENLKAQIDAFAAAAGPADRFVFYYVGQANIVDEKLRLNLPGADITHEELTQWLGRIKTASMLIVLDCPGAGLAVKSLAGQGRIIIAGCTAEQPYSTRFSEYFVPALTDKRSDADNDGRISLLEAFTAASKNLDDFYRRVGLLKTETPMLEDDGDGRANDQPWKHEQSGRDGLIASRFFLLKNELGAGLP